MFDIPILFGGLVGAHLCVRPCTKADCVQRADTSVGPYRGSKVDLYSGGLRIMIARSGRGKPRPYKGAGHV